MFKRRTNRCCSTRIFVPDVMSVWKCARLMFTSLILKKAALLLSCIRRNAGIAEAVPMIAPVPGPSSLTGRFNRGGTGKTRKPERLVSFKRDSHPESDSHRCPRGTLVTVTLRVALYFNRRAMWSFTASAQISYPLVEGCSPSVITSRGMFPPASRNFSPISR